MLQASPSAHQMDTRHVQSIPIALISLLGTLYLTATYTLPSIGLPAWPSVRRSAFGSNCARRRVAAAAWLLIEWHQGYIWHVLFNPQFICDVLVVATDIKVSCIRLPLGVPHNHRVLRQEEAGDW